MRENTVIASFLYLIGIFPMESELQVDEVV